MSKSQSRFEFAPARLLIALLFVGIFIMALQPATDADMWWHLATGEAMVETRALIYEDIFSYTLRGERWYTHEWLTELGMIALYRLGGFPLLIFATATWITAAFVLVYMQCENRPYSATFVTLLGAATSAVTWGVRPQMVTLLLAALFLWLIECVRKGGAQLVWAFPPLMALWVNLHGGYFLGLGLIAVILAGDGVSLLLHRPLPRTLSPTVWRNLLISLLLCVVATLLNPNGVHMLIYPFETLFSPAMRAYIQEWASPNFHHPAYLPFSLLLLGGALSLILSLRQTDWTDLLLFFGLGFAGLSSARHIPLFAVAATPIVTRALGPLSLARSSGRNLKTLNYALLILALAAAGLRFFQVVEQSYEAQHALYPVAAVDFIRTQDWEEHRVYNSYNWGGYLIWSGIPVYIDGRADVYGDAFIEEYLLAFQVRGDWRIPLEKYAVDYVLIEAAGSLATLLEEAPEWERVYQDELAMIFTRR